MARFPAAVAKNRDKDSHGKGFHLSSTIGRQIIDKDKHQPLKHVQDSESPDSNASNDSSVSAESLPEARAGKDVLLADQLGSDSNPTLVVDDEKSGSAESMSAGEEKAFVIDFGIATVLQSARSATTDVTRTGEIFGTPQYMSPEQCIGEAPDERSDIYSFGCLMYETLTGRPPFRGVNPVQIIMQHLKNSPPEFDSDIRKKKLAEQLELVTMKCLEKERQKRLPNFSAVKAELDRLASGVGQSSIKVYSKAPIMRRCCASILDGFIICVIYHFIASGSFYTERLSSIVIPTLSGTGVWTTLDAVVSSTSAALQSLLSGSAWPGAWLVLNYLQTSHRAPWLVLFPVIAVLYYCIFECSSFSATPGKMFFGLMVKSADYQSVSLTMAIKRLLLKLIGFQTCFIAAIVAPAKNLFVPSLVSNLINPPTDQWSGAEVVCQTVMPGQGARASRASLCIRFGRAFLVVLAAFLLLTPPLSYICAGLLALKIMYEDCRVLLAGKAKPAKPADGDDLGALRAESLTMAQAYKYRRLALIWLIAFSVMAALFHVPIVFTVLLLLPLIIYLRSHNARFRELSGQAALSSAPSWTTLFMRSLGNGRKKD
ncbi:MAG TPA: RDD family protein [Trichormus sp.]